MESKVITAHVPLARAARIDELAARLQRSRGWIMKQALEAWVDRADIGGKAQGFAEAQAQFEGKTRRAIFLLDGEQAEFGRFGRGDAASAVASLKSLRESTTLGDISWRELRDAGRK